jgi:hypothetical protein
MLERKETVQTVSFFGYEAERQGHRELLLLLAEKSVHFWKKLVYQFGITRKV